MDHAIPGHVAPDASSFLFPGTDLDYTKCVFEKFSLQVAPEQLLFFGHPQCGGGELEEVRVAAAQAARPRATWRSQRRTRLSWDLLREHMYIQLYCTYLMIMLI